MKSNRHIIIAAIVAVIVLLLLINHCQSNKIKKLEAKPKQNELEQVKRESEGLRDSRNSIVKEIPKTTQKAATNGNKIIQKASTPVTVTVSGSGDSLFSKLTGKPVILFDGAGSERPLYRTGKP